VVSLFAAGLLVYSQVRAFAWDEGFHLLAAQSINAGKRPYLDFCFSQVPLIAYWNAFWMRIFGETWRTPHAVAAIFTAGSVMLTAPVAPVLFVWMIFYNRAGTRWRKCTAFIAGAAIPTIPLLWLFVNGPRQVFFGVIEYNFLYRRLHWEGAMSHNLDVFMAWI